MQAGDVLAELSNPELTARAAEAAGELGLNESDLRTAQAHSAFAAAGQASAEHEQMGAGVAARRKSSWPSLRFARLLLGWSRLRI